MSWLRIDAQIVEKFRERYPGAGAILNLDCWNAFVVANPQTFSNMYMFSARRNAALYHAISGTA